MARILYCGFEVDNEGYDRPDPVELYRVTNVSFSSSVVRSGGYSLFIVSNSGEVNTVIFTNPTQSAFYRIYVRPSSLPTINKGLVGVTGVNITWRTDGRLEYRSSGVLIGTSTTALTDTSKWYRVEWRTLNGTNVPVLRIDGNNEVIGSPSGWTYTGVLGSSSGSGTYAAYFDDYAVDDSDWVGDSKLALLTPVSDNSRTNWVAGVGGTTNLYLAVQPPPGGVVSASETNTTNIESASNTGTANYIANLATYASAGITAADTIQNVQAVILHGEDVATGTKTGSVELTSNPVAGPTAFTFGNDSGGHGIYDSSTSLWKTARLNVAAPTVNVNNAPLMRLIKTDATTRTGCVCFMGLWVEYTPSSGPQNADLSPASIPSAEAFGQSTVTRGAVALSPQSIPTAEAFGQPSVIEAPPAADLSPNSIPTAEAFGQPALAVSAVSLYPTSIASAEAFEAPVVAMGAAFLSPTGIESGEAFGLTVLAVGAVSISPDGILSEETFGHPLVSLFQTSVPTSLLAAGGWTDQNGNTSGIVDALASRLETDYARSPSSPQGSTLAVGMQPVTDPLTDDHHYVAYRYRRYPLAGAGRSLTVRLLQGEALVAEWQHIDISGEWVVAQQALTTEQAESISDYGSLRVVFVAE
jgi:hypothetical protein